MDTDRLLHMQYTETLHVKKMADLVSLYNASNFWTKQI